LAADEMRFMANIAPQKSEAADVGYGSGTTDLRWSRDVRFAPNSCRGGRQPPCPLWAKSDREQLQHTFEAKSRNRGEGRG
jgi:hypothetical protein